MGKPKNRQEYRQQLAGNFINLLEESGLRWKQEWRTAGAPRNGVTNTNYKGCNAFHLYLISLIKGYNDPRWVTMVQIMDKKGIYHPNEKWHLQAGSKASYVEYWFPYDRISKKGLTWEGYRQEVLSGRPGAEFYLRAVYTPVFNASLVEGIPEIQLAVNPNVEQDLIIDKLSVNMGVPIINGGDRAFYSPAKDEIHLPLKEAFDSTYAYNSTALHELAHSTGHFSRLNRLHGAFFGSPDYAYEELIAEMSSCFMSTDVQSELTEEHIANHKAYVQSWVNQIREKPDVLVSAIKDAQAAANYMDWKAELITEQEYRKLSGQTAEVGIEMIEAELTPDPIISTDLTEQADEPEPLAM